PGGYVLSSGTDPRGVVCNGMSNYKRNSPWANSAVVVTVDHQKHFGTYLLGGLELRRTLEEKAFAAVLEAGGHKELPAQSLTSFLHGKNGSIRRGSSPSGEIAVRLDQILPSFILENLRKGLADFERKMPGFICEDAQLYGVESRTSCPLRITRDEESMQSVSHAGLYPIGEGAGYAGGITSAACDGVRVADKICQSLSSVSCRP
ncbi:MAG: hypothetical protein N2578_09590, partial [Bdellovibrionaceae bacterium]|nr:hypothetical protein [Pseudobdellovibrionaceae bacterium]